jgi:hypothetical protein
MGKPPQARPITVADVAQMSPQQRSELLHVLLVHYETEIPGHFKELMIEAYREAQQQLEQPKDPALRGTRPALRAVRRAPCPRRTTRPVTKQRARTARLGRRPLSCPPEALPPP